VSKGKLNLEKIYRKHFSRIKRIIGALRVRHQDFDDVVQVVLIEIHRSLHTFREDRGTLEVWLACITWRATIEYRKREYRWAENLRSHTDELAYFLAAAPVPNAEERMMEKDASDECRRLLYDAMDRMPFKRRQAFQLHVLAGEKQAVVAHILGVPESTVQSWIRMSWEELEGAVKRQRAQQRYSRMPVLPISAGALVERERARIEEMATNDDCERVWVKVRRTLREQRAHEEEHPRKEERPARASFKPSVLPPGLPLPPIGFRSLVSTTGISGGVAALIVWALMHGTPCTNVPLTVVESPLPSAAPMASPSTGAGSAPWTVIPASLTSVPVSPASASPDSGRPAVASSPLPSPSRRTALSAPPWADGEDAEENLLKLATAALDRGDFDEARADLDHHAREFPDGRLKTNRELLRQRLPH
jgi:RNA polymerase sigma factor (sigma-70 family)